MEINIPGIDIEKAIKNSGSQELFIELLGDVYYSYVVIGVPASADLLI